jgi:hypothetical protein
MLDGREFHRFVPEYRKVLLKYSKKKAVTSLITIKQPLCLNVLIT